MWVTWACNTRTLWAPGLQRISYCKMPYSKNAAPVAIRFATPLDASGFSAIVCLFVSLWLDMQRGGVHAFPTRSRGFVASLQSATPGVLSSTRPPRNLETTFKRHGRRSRGRCGTRVTGDRPRIIVPPSPCHGGGGRGRGKTFLRNRFGPPAAISGINI